MPLFFFPPEPTCLFVGAFEWPNNLEFLTLPPSSHPATPAAALIPLVAPPLRLPLVAVSLFSVELFCGDSVHTPSRDAGLAFC